MPEVLITSSTELMSNYKQAEVLAPDRKFEALQTNAGHALLFSIATDGGFYVTVETSGIKTGWQRYRISGGLPGAPTGATAKSFAVAQDSASGTISLALVMTAGNADSLYVSLRNSADELSWIQAPAWTSLPFDDAGHKLARTVIADVFINQAADGEFLAADVLRNPDDSEPLVLRYFIDPTKAMTGTFWNPHDVAGDVDAATAVSCLGRRAGDRVDGLYTAGQVGGQGQLFFQPLYNAFNPKIASNPARLTLPEGAVPRAIATAASVGKGTDLYVAIGHTVYFYPADGQHDGGTGAKIIDHPLFADVQRLFAFAAAGKVVLWGLNRSGQIFYVSSARATAANAAGWSVPLPICQGVEQVSPYVNRTNDANTFFVHTGVNQLQRAEQAPDTTTWKFENILLAALPDVKPTKFNSYTTRFQVTDSKKQLLPNVPIQLSALHRVGVFINGLYYILDTAPIEVRTDAIGSINVIEWVTTLMGTTIKASHAAGAEVSVNPMSKAFAKASALNSADALRGARITASDGTTRPLVAPGTGDDDLKAAAAALGQLSSIYKTLPADGSVKPPSAAAMRARQPLQVKYIHSVSMAGAAALHPQAVLGGIFDPIESVAGDVINWIDGAVNYVVHIVQDAATDLWHFVVEIAGKAYSFVLDAAAKVVGALVAIYNAIKTAIEDLIAYLKFLFEWKDFVRTKDVAKKLLLLSLGIALDRLDTVKQDVDGFIDDARTKVDNWAGVKADGWKASVENGNQQLGFASTLGDIEKALSAPAMFLYHHFVENLGGAKSSTASGQGSSSSAIINRVLTALANEGDIFLNAIGRIKSELIDGSAFSSMSLGDVLKKLTAIVVDAFLDGAKNLIDALLDFFVMVARAGLEELDTPIWIPVVSDILHEFGITIDFSMLDFLLMIAAVPATIIYKLVNGSAPFSSGDGFSDKILAANKAADLAAAFPPARGPSHLNAPMPMKAMTGDAPDSGGGVKVGLWIFSVQLNEEETKTVYVVCHAIAGIGALVSAVLVPASIMEDPIVSVDTALTAAGLVTGIAAATAALVDSPKPIKDREVAVMAKVLALLTLATKLSGGKAVDKVFGDNATAAQKLKIRRAVDAVIAFVSLTPSVYHFQELAQIPASSPRSSAIVGETAAIVNNITRILAFFLAIDQEPESKTALAVAMTVLLVTYSGLQFAEAMISPT